MEKKEIVFAEWIYYNEREYWDYTFRSVSVWPKFNEFYEKNKNDKWYVNLDLKVSKWWKAYVQLNTYQPKKEETEIGDIPKTQEIPF